MPTTRPENCSSRMISSMWRLRMNRTPFSRARTRADGTALRRWCARPLATLRAVLHQPRRKMARADAADAGILARDRPLLDVGRRAFHEKGMARRARDMPPLPCVPEMRPMRT